MDLHLAGKTVLITGASKGIGLACAHEFAAEGCNLHLASRTEVDLAAARDAITAKHGVDVTIHALDLSDSTNVDTLAARCADIDILVNNAGAIPAGDIQAIDEKIWREAWDLKVFGYVNMTRRFYPLMQNNGGGVILTSSVWRAFGLTAITLPVRRATPRSSASPTPWAPMRWKMACGFWGSALGQCRPSGSPRC